MRFYSGSDIAVGDGAGGRGEGSLGAEGRDRRRRRRFSVRSDPTRIYASSKLRTSSSSSEEAGASDGDIAVSSGGPSSMQKKQHPHIRSVPSKRTAGFFNTASKTFATRGADLEEDDFGSDDEEEESDVEMTADEEDDFLGGQGLRGGGREFEIFGHR
jgi:hypothetical protein